MDNFKIYFLFKDSINKQLVIIINGIQITDIYLSDSFANDDAELPEILEEFNYLMEAYLKPAITEIDLIELNLIRLLSIISPDSGRVSRLFTALNEHLPNYYNILNVIAWK